ncbi:MAG: hypothetical protein ACLTNK_11100 [Akkermansia muciniphila]
MRCSWNTLLSGISLHPRMFHARQDDCWIFKNLWDDGEMAFKLAPGEDES